MATRETSRLHIPYPGKNDKGDWDAKFVTMLAQIDARVFANLEHTNLTIAALPTVLTDAGTHIMTQTGALSFVSRTYNCTVTVATGATATLRANAMLGIQITSGITGNVTADNTPSRMSPRRASPMRSP